MRILIADDEDGIEKVVKALLQISFPRCHIDCVVNGADAVESVRLGRYDILWLDVCMPDMTGYDVCLELQELCKREQLKMPFIIFCSGYKVPAEIEALLVDTSRYAFTSKPEFINQLVAAIQVDLPRIPEASTI